MSSLYCPACGAMTWVQEIERAGRRLSTCRNCGLALQSSEAFPYRPLREVLFADDSDLLRLAIEDVLLQRGLAQSVLAARDGQEFLQTFVRRLREGQPVDLAMLDVKMPRLAGFEAAIAMRGIERGFDLPAPTPLIFFSSQPCDDAAREVLHACGRALYVNKVASSNLGDLALRVEQVLVNLLTKDPRA